VTDLRSIDLDALNSATKYPSIPTYHALGEKGRLTEDAVPFSGTVHLTEKVDGTNARIAVLPGGAYVIGSREELLYARGDVIANPALGIVDALRAVADTLPAPDTGVRVHYLEVYGGRIGGASRQYSGTGAVSHRLFDVADVDADVLTWPRVRISAWREEGGQRFLSEDALAAAARGAGLDLVPRLGEVDAALLPTGVQEMSDLLAERLPATRVGLDDTAGGAPEGIVLRTADRSTIATARFQDYRRTLKAAARR
jgi:hypothetical protein